MPPDSSYWLYQLIEHMNKTLVGYLLIMGGILLGILLFVLYPPVTYR